MSRKSKSIKNIGFALIGQGVGLVINFIARMVFIRILGSDYLGLNGLFANILTVLSLAELGVGEAIIFSLYKPLADGDCDKSKMLMNVYKKIYIIIGIVIIVLGLLLIPFLPFFINEMPQISNINLIYMLFVINTGVSYFFSYKRNLIIADQNRYIATLYRYVFFFLLNVLQILYLFLARDYIGFLLLQIVFTLLENIFISRKANNMYPYLKDRSKTRLDKETKHELIMNTRAMMMHRIGGTIVSSTDNILISKLIGLVEVGMYSNYSLITNALNIIFGQFYSSVLASVGNLCVKSDSEKKFEIFKRIDFLGFLLYSFSAICLLNLFNPIIAVWVGDDYTFHFGVVVVIVLNFYITGMRKSVLTFREATGLFYKDRWKAIIEAIINLVFSIVLAIKMGVLGVLLGTLISSLAVCVWVEPYLLFKYVFKRNLRIYFRYYLEYFLFTLYVALLTVSISLLVNYEGFAALLIKALLCTSIYLINILVFFRKNLTLKYYKDLFLEYFRRLRKFKSFKTN